MNNPLFQAIYDHTPSQVISVLTKENLTARTDEKDTALHVAAQYGSAEWVQILVVYGADVTATNASKYTPLHTACRSSERDSSINPLAVVQFLSDKTPLEACTDIQETALHLAAVTGSREIVEHLLAKGANLEARTAEHATPLQLAWEMEHWDVVKVLLKRGANITGINADDCNPIHFAYTADRLDIVQLLLQKSSLDPTADQCSIEYHNHPCLHLAVVANDVAQVKALLECHPALLNATDHQHSTPLNRAAECGHQNVVQCLLDNGAAVGAQDSNGGTPLHYAAAGGYEQVVKFLLDNGAVVYEQDNDGCTPLHYTAVGGYEQVVKFLLDNGAVVDAKDNDGCTPLHYAAANGYKQVVKFLLDNGAVVYEQDNDGCTPLHKATEGGYKEVVPLLCEHHATVNLQDHKKRTPLHYAAEGGHLDVVQCLLNHDALVDAQDFTGRTPLHKACHLAVIKILFKHKADLEICNGAKLTPLASIYTNCNISSQELERIFNFLIQKKVNVFTTIENFVSGRYARTIAAANLLDILFESPLLSKVAQEQRAILLLNHEKHFPLIKSSVSCQAFRTDIKSEQKLPVTRADKAALFLCVLFDCIEDGYLNNDNAQRVHEYLNNDQHLTAQPITPQKQFQYAYNAQKWHLLKFFDNRRKLSVTNNPLEKLYTSQEPMIDRIPYIRFNLINKLFAPYLGYIKQGIPTEIIALILGYIVLPEINQSETYTTGFLSAIFPYLPQRHIAVSDLERVGNLILKLYMPKMTTSWENCWKNKQASFVALLSVCSKLPPEARWAILGYYVAATAPDSTAHDDTTYSNAVRIGFETLQTHPYFYHDSNAADSSYHLSQEQNLRKT